MTINNNTLKIQFSNHLGKLKTEKKSGVWKIKDKFMFNVCHGESHFKYLRGLKTWNLPI